LWGETGGRETGRKGGGRCTGGGRRGGGKREKKGKIMQHCAIFRNRKNAKRREQNNTGREPGLQGTGSGRFKPPCPPHFITSAFSINKVQALITFTLVRATSVDALMKLVRAVKHIFINTLVDIWKITKKEKKQI